MNSARYLQASNIQQDVCKNMPFQPGNQEPRKAKKAKPFRDALRMEMAAAEQGQPCPAPKGSLRWNARQLLERGDPVAIREIADRLDGKVKTIRSLDV